MNIHEVARRAKVSIATVSRTVNRVPTVNPKIATRVWLAIDELGYHPDAQARALVSGRSHTLGLIVSDINNPFFPEIIRAFEEVALAAGFEVLLSSTNYDPAKMAGAVRRMLGRKVEGVAVMTSEMQDSLISQLTQRKVPLSFIDVAPDAPHVSNIVVDYRKGIQEAVQHLISLGHKQLGFVSGPQTLKSSRLRRDIFLECLHANNVVIEPHFLVEGDHSMQGGCLAVSQMLRGAAHPTAILTSNDLTAVGVLVGLSQGNLRVPHDVSVIGFDDIDLASFTLPALTTVRLSRTELAERSFKALMADIAGETTGSSGTRHEVGTALVVRGSTGMAAARS